MNRYKIIKEVSECLTIAKKCIVQFRKQNFHAGLKFMRQFSTDMINLTNDIMSASDILLKNNCTIDMHYLSIMLSDIMDVQEKRDYVLLPDLLELQIIPFFLQFQESLLAVGCCIEDYFESNMCKLLKRDEHLYNELRDFELQDVYVVEPTSVGQLTLRVKDDTGSYYMHSNVDPIIEGDIFAEQYYCSDYNDYIVFGLGFGYHIQALLEIDDGICIDIIEPDLEIIKTAFSVMDMSWLLDNDRICLVYDADYQELKIRLKENKLLLIHYPSLRHIKDSSIKLSLEKYFIHDSGVRNMSHLFVNNFRDNILNCTNYVDELLPEFEGKNAVIVAAGPSLDKNVELLKKCPENTIVIAVGTVFYKLITMEIKPDYVIFLDAQPHLYNQIKGLEEEDVPIICAATACKKIAEKYQGKKYLICQYGYEKSEDFANEKGYTLYETGGSVSTIALDLCLKMRCNSIAFIGLDLAFTDNYTHATNTSNYALEDEENKEAIRSIDGGTVMASKLFIIYREWIERRIAKVNFATEIIDATEGGALIKGMKNMKLQEVFNMWELQEL